MTLPKVSEVDQTFRKLLCRSRNAEIATQDTVFSVDLIQDRLFTVRASACGRQQDCHDHQHTGCCADPNSGDSRPSNRNHVRFLSAVGRAITLWGWNLTRWEGSPSCDRFGPSWGWRCGRRLR